MKYQLKKLSFIVLIIIMIPINITSPVQIKEPTIILNNKTYFINTIVNLNELIKEKQIENYNKNIFTNVTFLLFLSLMITLGTKISINKYQAILTPIFIIIFAIIFILIVFFIIASFFIQFSPKIILLLSFLILFISSIMLGFLLEYISKKYQSIMTLISWENCGPVLAGLLATLIINYFFPMALNIINTILISAITIISIILFFKLIFKINFNIPKVFINYLGVLSAWIGLMEAIKFNEKFIEDYKISPIMFNDEDWNMIMWNNSFYIAITFIDFIIKILKYLIEKERQKKKSRNQDDDNHHNSRIISIKNLRNY